jgi:hypothetical protein
MNVVAAMVGKVFEIVRPHCSHASSKTEFNIVQYVSKIGNSLFLLRIASALFFAECALHKDFQGDS